MDNINILLAEGEDLEELILNPAAIGLMVEMPNAVEVLALNDDVREPTRITNYVEEVIPRYNPDEFFTHFRMSRNVFQELLEDIRNKIDMVSTIPVDKKLFFTIWMLAKQESYRACCDRFGISIGTGNMIFHQICEVLCTLVDTEIRWPTMDEASVTARYFTRKRFSGVIGAIDGCHIPIKAPKNNHIDYYNRNSYHSMILQGVCDHKMLFIDIFVGMPGRVHDARVFRNSPLYDEMMDNPNFISPDMHLLGDSAYPLLQKLMIPFRENGHLTNLQRQYNTVHSACRSKIEQAFGRLKGKWRRLKYLDMDLQYMPHVITAACVLHNYTLRRQGDNDNIDDADMPVEDHEIGLGDGEAGEQPDEPNAIEKRNLIMHAL